MTLTERERERERDTKRCFIWRRCQLLRWYDRYGVNKIEYGTMVEWHWQGKIDVREQKPVPFPLGIAKIQHGLAWNRTRVATMTARRRVGQELRRIECDKTFRNEIENFGPHMVEASINIFSRFCPFRELKVFWYICKFYLKPSALPWS